MEIENLITKSLKINVSDVMDGVCAPALTMVVINKILTNGTFSHYLRQLSLLLFAKIIKGKNELQTSKSKLNKNSKESSNKKPIPIPQEA